MADMDTECLTEFLKEKKMSLDEFKKLDHQSEEYKNLTKEYEPFFEKWKEQQKEKPAPEPALNQSKEKEPVKNLVINEGVVPNQEERSNDPENEWKERYAKEWRIWGDHNKLDYKDASLPSKGDALSFRFYEGKSENYAAEITYTSPYNVTLRGSNGETPDNKFFEKAVSMAVKNGTAIEFGEITSAEFKAKLLAACYKQGNAQIVNGPSAEEMAAWPEHLKIMVDQAKKAGENKPVVHDQAPKKEAEAEPQPKPNPKVEEIQNKIARLKEIKQKFNDPNYTQIDWEKTDVIKDAAKIKEDLTKAGFSAEEADKYIQRKQANAGDQKAQQEINKRRAATMTDEYKYEREVELDADNNPKKDEKGNPIYKKDKDGKFIYKTNDKGQKIETAAYQAFLKRAQNGLSK